MKDRILAGKCFCGAVQYEVADAFLYAMNCHCSNCRRTTGSAFKPFAGIEREKLALTAGANGLLVYGNDKTNDTHCKRCGHNEADEGKCKTVSHNQHPFEFGVSILHAGLSRWGGNEAQTHYRVSRTSPIPIEMPGYRKD